MDTESSLSAFTTNDEFEGIEVAEFDANGLWELLHDEPGEEEAAGGGGAPMQAMEADGPKPDTLVESYWCLNDFNNNNSSTVQDFDWFRIMEETSTACNDMGGWYGEPCMEEMNQILEIGDYSISQSEILADEIGYIGLWLDN